MALQISRILHAGYVFQCEGVQIAFDPIFENPFSRNCYAFPGVKFDEAQIRSQRFNAVFISHYHDDHCSLESLDFLDRSTPIYLYCIFDELFQMIRELGFTNVHPLELNKTISIGPFEVTPRRALDADVDSIFQIRAGGVQVLNVVDSWIDDETLDLLKHQGPWDMALWPFQTMRELEVLSPARGSVTPSPAALPELPPEWIEQLRVLNPTFIVPSSCQFIHEPWSWYNHALFPISYAQFGAEVSAALPEARVTRMNPSVSVILSKSAPSEPATLAPAAPLTWIQPVGNQNVDYSYRPELQAPTTAEISRNFDALSANQAARVYDYCTHGLLEKFRSIDPPIDPYFEKPHFWRLRVYDHKGHARTFVYTIEKNGIDLNTGQSNGASEMATLKVGWTTDVAIAKLYGALENGESLTSMYLRINEPDGATFESSTEIVTATVDVVEDPLIRCLFNGVFGAYQAAQLRNLKRH